MTAPTLTALPIVVQEPTVLITEFHERADSRPIWCDHCHGVTIQKLERTRDGRLYCCECGEETIYLQVARLPEISRHILKG